MSTKKDTKADFGDAATGNKDIKVYKTEGEQVELRFENLNLELPSGEDTLIRNMNLVIKQGEKVAMTGANGSGKSSLFRVLQKLWNFGTGTIETTGAADTKIMCASQKSRMPDTALDGILSYPSPADTFTREQYEKALEIVEFDKIKVQLPWNAVKPKNIMRVCENVLEKHLGEAMGKFGPNQLDAFMRGFEKGFRNAFDIPEYGRPYFGMEEMENLLSRVENEFTKTYQAALKEKETNDKRAEAKKELSEFKKEVSEVFPELLPESEFNEPLETSPGKLSNKNSRFFPQRAGRKAGEELATAMELQMNRWMIRGENMSLSGGEEQKLVFARIYLQEPDVLFLDEVTSALQSDTAHKLYSEMLERLPETIVISIVHNPSLIKYHDRHIDLRDKTITANDVDMSTDYEAALKDKGTCQACPHKPKP